MTTVIVCNCESTPLEEEKKRRRSSLLVLKVLQRGGNFTQGRGPVLLYPISLALFFMFCLNLFPEKIRTSCSSPGNDFLGHMASYHGTTRDNGSRAFSSLEVNPGGNSRSSTMRIFGLLAEIQNQNLQHMSEATYCCVNCISTEEW
jgi:hypothetical protein